MSDVPQAIKAEIDRLAANFERINALEDQIKTLAEKGEGVAEIKAEVNKIANDNADAVKAMQERQDAFEAEAAKRLRDGRTGAAKSAGRQFVESEAFKGASDRTAVGPVRVERKAITVSADMDLPNYTGEIVRPQDAVLTVRDLVPVGRSARDIIKYHKLTTRATAAAAVAAGELKPESSLAYADADAPMIKLAHYIVVTEEQLSDIDGLASDIDAELEYGLRLAEDTELLNGDGTTGHLDGLIPNATAYAAATYGDTVTNPQRLDHVRGMIAQLAVARFAADGIVLHPTTWFQIETTKTEEGAYIFANPTGRASANLWGLPVAVTDQVSAGNALVGAFRLAAMIYEGQLQGDYGIVMRTGQPSDFFLRNKYAVIAEERIAQAVKRPLALVYGSVAGT